MPLTIFAQGFNWQYSARLPFKYPNLFGGLNGSFNYLYNDATLKLSEGNGDCCNFGLGRGFGTNLGVDFEYWPTYHAALNLKINYNVNSSDFLTNGEILPFSVFDSEQRLIGHDTAYFQNKMSTKLNYLQLRTGGKMRISETHFFFGFNVTFSYLLSSRIIQTESVIEPTYWRYNDGSTERQIADYELTDINKFNLFPSLQLGYDLPLALGIYAVPSLSVDFPIMDIATKGTWRTWSVGLNLSIYNAILSK
jgi:hypothetical protein